MISSSDLSIFQQRLGYNFTNQELLVQALSHPSLRQHKLKNSIIKDNERLEFLGDSIVGFIITEIIFKDFIDYDEGKLAMVKSHLVCKQALCKIALKIDLASYIIMTYGEELSGGRTNSNNLENTIEALIAAIYLDSNIIVTKSIVEKLWGELFLENDLTQASPKSALQELAQKLGFAKPTYILQAKEGSSHAPSFTIEARVDTCSQLGYGSTIKSAEKDAATKLLQVLQQLYNKS